MSTLTSHASRLARRATLALALAAGVGAASASAALAETYTVTRTDDPPPANCIPGDCTLREAINASNNNGPGAHDTIVLQGGQTYTLQQPAGNAPTETGGALIALHNVTLTSSGTANAVVNGNGGTTHDRVFDVLGGGLELHHVDVDGGVASRLIEAGGGGVLVDGGAFYMFDGQLAGNSAPEFGMVGGGGIYNYSGHAVLQRVMVAGNHADNSYGGGIYTGPHGLTEVYDSKLFDNAAALGGALASDERESGGNVYVDRAQISFNRADTAGGAAFDRGSLDGDGVTYRFANVTINNNVAQHDGGALSVWTAHVTLNNDTVTLNNAALAGGIAGHGDPYEKPGATAVRLSNTIVAQNLNSGAAPDCRAYQGGEFVSGGYNLIGNDTGCTMLQPGPGDQLGTGNTPIDAKLHTTAFNGGLFNLLLTAALDPGSPAINAGDPAGSCEPTDARGVLRSAGGRCDIGAYEVTPPPVTVTPHTNNAQHARIALRLSRNQVRAGTRVLLGVTLSSTDQGCVSGTTVHAGPHDAALSDRNGHVTLPVRFRHAGAVRISAAKPGCVAGATTLMVVQAH